jgi:transposase
MGWRSGQSYSQDLRDRVLSAVDGGMAVREAATTFKVSIAYIYKALIRRRLTGDAGINPNRGRPPRKLSSEQELTLAAHIRSRPGITLAQAQTWLLAEHGVEISTGAMWNAARRLGLSFKKSAAGGRAGPARRRRKAQAVESSAAVHRS